MIDSFNRWLYVTRIRLRVAYGNYSAEKIFSPDYVPLEPKKFIPIFAFFALFFLGAGISFAIFPDKTRMADAGVPAGTGVPADVASLAPVAVPLKPPVPPGGLPPAEKEIEEKARAALQQPGPAGTAEPTYSVAVDKKRRKVFVLRENGDYYEVVKTYEALFGKAEGPKEREGDMKTPEGIYRVVGVKEEKELLPIHGPRAFVLNYPNDMDHTLGRSGGGIWLHGTGPEARPDTKGCVALSDKNILELGRWVKTDTSIAIFPERFSLPLKNGRVERKYLTSGFFYGNVTPARSSG